MTPERPLVDWVQWYDRLLVAEALAAADTPDTRERLERARSLIHAHYDEPLDLARLARQACFSRHHFLRAFQREFELTPHQYLTKRRLEAARHLLSTTAMSVTEVCLAVGFTSLGSFSTLFRRHVGRSPADYRALHVAGIALPRPRVLVPSCFFMRHRPCA